MTKISSSSTFPSHLMRKECTLNVSGLTRNVTENHLKEIFGIYGAVKSICLPPDKQFAVPKGYAYIEFMTRSNAIEAQRCLDDGQIDGRGIKVDFILLPDEDKRKIKKAFGTESSNDLHSSRLDGRSYSSLSPYDTKYKAKKNINQNSVSAQHLSSDRKHSKKDSDDLDRLEGKKTRNAAGHPEKSDKNFETTDKRGRGAYRLGKEDDDKKNVSPREDDHNPKHDKDKTKKLVERDNVDQSNRKTEFKRCKSSDEESVSDKCSTTEKDEDEIMESRVNKGKKDEKEKLKKKIEDDAISTSEDMGENIPAKKHESDDDNHKEDYKNNTSIVLENNNNSVGLRDSSRTETSDNTANKCEVNSPFLPKTEDVTTGFSGSKVKDAKERKRDSGTKNLRSRRGGGGVKGESYKEKEHRSARREVLKSRKLERSVRSSSDDVSSDSLNYRRRRRPRRSHDSRRRYATSRNTRRYNTNRRRRSTSSDSSSSELSSSDSRSSSS